MLGDTAVTRKVDAFDTGLLSYRSGYELVARPWRPRQERLTLLASVELDTFIAAQGALTNARANLQLRNIVLGFAIVSLVLGAVNGWDAGSNLWKARKAAPVEASRSALAPRRQ